MVNKNKTRTVIPRPTDNKTLSIGILLFVDAVYEKLGLERVFSPLKERGVDPNTLVRMLIAYKLVENNSISKAATWAAQPHIRDHYGVGPVSDQTFYRFLERMGPWLDLVMDGIQDALFSRYDFPKTDVNLDWTSITLHGTAAELGAYGYSRDHRPDKHQMVVGVAELAGRVNMPIGMTVRAGNVNDQVHFADTFAQVVTRLRRGSLVIFDKGASSQANKERIRRAHLHYLYSKKLNRADDARIASFWKGAPELVDEERQIYAVTHVKPRSVDHLFYSHVLHGTQTAGARRRARALVDEAAELQRDLDAGRKIKKKYRGGPSGNCLIDARTTFQTKLVEMSEEEAYRYALAHCTNGREGFFCLKTSTHLTAAEALTTYRRRDTIEKLFHSLKNEIEIRPVRCWKKERQIGVLLIGFLAQLFVSLLRYEVPETSHMSTKFILQSLRNLTDTVMRGPKGRASHVYSNFDPVNMAILRHLGAMDGEKAIT